MRLAFITPTAYLNKFSKQGGIYLALAHLVDDEGRNEYTRFHINEKRKGKTVYLDNGLFEGAQVDSETLVHRARVLKADIVCAPDSLFNSRETIKEFKKFIKLKQEMGLVAKVMGIPQADSQKDWWDCYQFFDTNKNCDIIGLSILSVPKSFRKSVTEAREHLIRQLYLHSYMSGKKLTPMHMLGLGDNYNDIKLANKLLPREILSCDSSSAFVHGANGVVYNKEGEIWGGKIKDKLDFSLREIGEYEEGAIQTNINIAKEIAGDYVNKYS